MAGVLENREISGDPEAVGHFVGPEAIFCAENLIAASTIVIAFSSLGVDRPDKAFEMLGLLDRTDCASILLRDLDSTWFHAPRSFPEGALGLAALLRARTAPYERVICLGYSMGGYAALQFGDLLGADEVLAFAPQTALSSHFLSSIADYRWDQFLPNFRDRVGEGIPLDLAPTSRAKKLSIFIAQHNNLDRVHAERMTPSARIVPLGDGPLEHGALVVALRETGLLRSLIDSAVAGSPGPDEAVVFRRWETDRSHRFEIEDVAPGSVNGAWAVKGILTLTSQATLELDRAGEHPIRLGARLYRRGTPWHEKDYRYDLPSPRLEPGVRYPFYFELQAEDVGSSPAELRIALVKEGRCWFDDLGLGQARVPFNEPAIGGPAKSKPDSPALLAEKLGLGRAAANAVESHPISSSTIDKDNSVIETASKDTLESAVQSRQWFHRINLGNGIQTPGIDDTQHKLAALGLPEDLSGKTVLDVGAWDGFFSFESERRGASRVVATDSFCWNGTDMQDGGGFRLAHAALGSRVVGLNMRVEDLDPSPLGTFDYVLFLGVLYHTRDPLGYLAKVRSVCRGTAIIETWVDGLEIDRPALIFYPGAALNNDATNFFGPNEAAVIEMCKEVGFSSVDVVNRHFFPNRMVFHAHV